MSSQHSPNTVTRLSHNSIGHGGRYGCSRMFISTAAAQNRETQEWKNEKPKLDNVRRLRGYYFIVDPGDQYYKKLSKIRRKKEKTYGSRHAAQKGKPGLVVSSLLAKHEDRNAGKGCTSICFNHRALVPNHSFSKPAQYLRSSFALV